MLATMIVLELPCRLSFSSLRHAGTHPRTHAHGAVRVRARHSSAPVVAPPQRPERVAPMAGLSQKKARRPRE
jgi:hypothetical protein